MINKITNVKLKMLMHRMMILILFTLTNKG